MIATNCDDMGEASSVRESKSGGRRRSEDDDEDRFTKAKRHDVELPVADSDIKLAQKLDSILKLGKSRKPRFYTYKPRDSGQNQNASVTGHLAQEANTPERIMQRRNLTKQELEERLAKHYDTLIPELDKNRPVVRVVKILSATESMKLAENVAKKQLARELELSSVSGNRLAHEKGIGAFRFEEDCDEPSKKKDMIDAKEKEKSPPPPKINTSSATQEESMKPAQCRKKTVRFSNVEDQSDGVLVLGYRYGDFFDSDDDDMSDHSNDASSVDTDEKGE